MKAIARRAALTVVVTSLLSVVACGDDDADGGDSAAAGPTTTTAAEWPATITYGLLPTADVQDLVSRFTPFEEYMEGCLEHPFDMFTSTNYTAMIEAMRTGNVHVSRFGPFSYILAHERAGADALVVAVDDVNTPTYHSSIVTLSRHGFEDIADLEGTSFAFVDPTSTSGHLVPRAMVMEAMGIENEEVDDFFGEVVFAGNHSAAIISVLNGDVEAAAIASNSGVFEGSMDDHANIGEFTVLAESDEIPRTVEAVQEDLPDDLKEALRGCYEGLADDPALAEFREDIGLAFIPASDSDYDVVRDVAEAMNMSPEQLLEG